MRRILGSAVLLGLLALIGCSDGAKGPAGPQGPKGDKGDAGSQGEQGLQGAPGERGATGDRGERGEQGPPGPPLTGLVRLGVACKRDEILIGAYCTGAAVVPSVSIAEGVSTVACTDIKAQPAKDAKAIAVCMRKP